MKEEWPRPTEKWAGSVSGQLNAGRQFLNVALLLYFCIMETVKYRYDIKNISEIMAEASSSVFVKKDESGGDEENILVFPTFSHEEEEAVVRWKKF